MATLFELKDEILKGRKVRRQFGSYINDVFADDWELEPLPKAKKKIKLYAWLHPNDGTVRFYRVTSDALEFVHFNGNRLPALDQEIEVEE